MRSVRIQKATHWREPFRPDKLVRSLERVGADPQHVAAVFRRLQGRLRAGLTTADLSAGVAAVVVQSDQRVAAQLARDAQPIVQPPHEPNPPRL